MNKFLHLIFFALLMAFNAQADLQAQGCDCTNCPLTLPDQLTQTFTGTLVVQGATNNTLGTNNTLQQVCINITHDWIGDLDITLIAPNGTQVVLFGDGNNDTSLGGTETCPCGNSGDDMNVCFVLSGTTNDFSLSNAGTGNICNGNQGAYVACNGTGGQPCYTGNWLPYDQNCNGPDAGLSAMNNGGSVNGTWQLIIHDNAGSNQGILNDFSLVFANTTGINCNSGCNANAGTTNATGGTGTGSNATTRILCSGESVSLVSNDNYVLPNPMTGEASELMYAIYECAPPANPNPDVDACYSGLLWTAEDFNTANGGSYVQNIGGGIPQPFIDLGVTGTNNTLWFVPITCDDSDNNGNPNGIINWDQDGDNCFDLGTPIAIVYSAVPDVIIVPDCNPNTNNGSVTFTVIGSGTYTINETGAGNLTGGTSINAGQSFTINNLNNTNVWSFSLSQGGCATTFSGTFACAADICLVDAVIIPNPPPSNFPNNQYPPNTTVTFCIDINQYNQTNLNFLHGIVPSFSGGWQSTITPTTAPSVAALNEQGSYWQWQAGNTILHNNGTNSNGDNFNVANPGWWFHSVNSTTNNTAPTNAANSWGDGCTPICYPNTTQAICQAAGYQWVPGCGCTGEYVSGTYYDLWVGPSSSLFEDIVDNSMTSTVCAAQGGDWDSFLGICAYNHCIASPTTGMGLNWYACFQLTTLADPACLGNTNLNVSVQTYADGLTGAWDEYGCTADAPVTWTGTMCCLPAPTENTAATFCQGTNITLTANAPATGQINWFGNGVATGGTPIGVGNSFNVGTLAPGSYTYYIEANNGGCTSNRTPVAFTVNPLPTLTIVNGDAISCTAGSAVNISLTAANIVGNVTWTSSPAGFTATGTSINPTPSVTTTYTASATNGCGTVTVPISVTINTITPPNVPNSTLCGASTTLNAGAGYEGYQWSASGGGTISGANNIQTITVTSAGTYTVTVTNNGCSATDNAVISVPTNPTITGPTSVCSGGGITLDAGAGYSTYSWSNSGGSGQTATFNNVTTNTTYTVTVTTASGCTLTDTHTVTVTSLPTVNDPSDQSICAGANTAAVNFSGTAGATFNWTNNTTSIGLAASGSGNIGAFTATNATTAPVTATITVTPTISGCPGTPQTFTITVNPLPTVTDPSDQALCAGASTTAVNFSGTAGATFNWTNNTTSIGLAASGSGNIGAFTAINATAAPVTATITVTPTLSGCPGTPQTFTITVNPTPSVTDPSDQALCAGASTTAVNFSGTAGATFNWTNNTTSIGLAANGSGNIGAFTATNATAAPVTATITVTPTISGCPGTPQTFTITVNPLPTVTDPSDQALCAGASTTAVNFSGTAGATFNWTNNTTSIGLAASGSGNIGAFTAINATAAPVTATITVTPTLSGCPGTPQTFTITVNPTPSVTDPSDQAVCEGASVAAISFSGTAGATFNWTNSNTAIGLGASGSGNIGAFTATNTGSTPISATITVTPVLGTCPGTAQTFTITVNASNPVTLTPLSAVCATAAPISLNTTQSGITGTWSGTNVTGGNSFNPSGLSGPITLTFAPNGTQCADISTTTITVNPAPTFTITGSTSFCAGGNTTLSAPAGMSTYAWVASAGGTISGPANGQSITATTAGTYAVTITDSNGCTAFNSVAVTQAAALSPNISGGGTICADATPAVLDAGSGFTTYAWSASGGGTISGGAASQTINATTTGTYTVTVTQGACSGTGNTTLTVNPLPTVTDPTDQSICNNVSTTAINFAGTAGATFNWANDNISIGLGATGTGNITSFTAINSGTTPVTANITVTPTLAGCLGTPQTVTITVNPLPTVSDPSDQTVCAGVSTAAVNFSGTAGATFNWTNDTPSIGLAASGSGNIGAFTATNATASPVTATITVTPTLAGCPGAPQTFTITVNPSPTVTDPTDQSLCAGATTTAVSFSGTAGATFNWTNNTTSIGLAASGSGNISAFTATNATSAPVTATITVTPTLAGCPGTPQTFNIVVNPLPTVTDPSDQTVCGGVNTAAVSFSGTAGATFNWTNNTPSIGLAASGSGNIGAFTATNATASPVTATITVTPTLAGCPGTPQTFTITVNPSPTVTDPSDQSLCAGATTTAVSFSGTAGATFNWTNNTPSIGLAASGSGNIGAFTATNATTSPVTATITVTPTLAGCPGTPQSFNIVVNPQATVTDPADVTACAGVATTAISFSGTAGATFNWTNDNTAIGLPASGVGNISAFTPTNTGTTPIVATITVSPTLGTCNGTPQTFTITVNPTPTVNPPSNQTLCAGQSTTAITLSGSAGATFNWTNNTPSIGLPASGSGNISAFTAVNATASPITATITVTPVAGSCSGAAQTFTITVNPLVTPTLSVSPTTMCASDSPIALNTTQSGIIGVWSGNGVSGNSFDPFGLSGSITLTFNANTGQCANNNTVNITVTAPTSVTLTPLSPICDIATPISLATTQSGITGTWSGDGVSGDTFDPSGQSGTVTLTFTPNSGQCRLASTVDITVNTALPTTLQSFAGLCSLDAAIPLPTTQGGITGVWSGNGVSANSFNPSGLSGAITLTFTPSGIQCALLNTTTIAVNPASAAAPSGIGDQCATGGIVPLSTNQGGLNGTWSGTGVSANSFNPSGLSGPVTLTFDPVPGQCATAGTITINVIAPATAGNDASSTACDNASEGTSSIDLSTLTSVAGGTFAPVGSAPALTGTTFNGVGLTVGTAYQYSYTVTATPPCSDAVATVSITVNDCASCPNPPTAGFSYASPYCANAGTATITLSAGASAGTFTAVPAGLSINATTGAVDLATSTPGTYTVTNSIPATGACPPATATADITINAIPTLSDPSDQSICAGQNTALVAFNGTPVGTTFAWTNSNPAIGLAASGNGDIPAFATTGAGTATITVTPTFNGCVGTAQTFAITVNALPTINAPADVEACAGVTIAPVLFSGTAGASFAWTNSNTAIGLAASGNGNLPAFTATNSGSSPITATITVTPSLGTAPNICTGTPETFTITINPLPTANAGADQAICAGSSANLTASGGTSYQWSNGLGNAANATASPALTTTYTVTVTDNGCSATDAVTVNVAAMPTLVIGAVDCSADLTNYTINYTASNGTATASAGTLGATSISNIPIATTPVTITVTSATNAACLVSQDVNAPNCNCPSIAAPTGNDATICQGATIPALTVNVGAGLSVNWYATSSGGAALVSNSTSYTPTTAGTYYAEAIDAVTGCTSATRTPIVLTVTPLPIANAGADQDICAGSSTNLTASGGTSYQWSNGLGNAANATASPALTTTYTVTVTDNGCSATDAVTVNVAAMPTLVIGAVDCSADLTNYTINYTASNGTATASAGTLGATSISNIPIATTPVTITVTSATNATCAVSQDVNAPNCNCPSIAAPTGNDATICQGATIPALTVNVGAGLSVNWYATSSGGAALVSNSNSYTPTTAGTYYAEAIDATTGCTSATRTPIVLTITPLPIANAGADQDICAGSSANLTASGGTSYQWSNGLGNAANATASPALTTTYTVTVTDNGCSATDAVTVNVAAMPTLVIGAVDCSADLTNYTINYTATNGTATASAGTLGATSISNIPIATTPVTITVTSATNAACLVSQDVNAPNCNCPSIAAPTGNDATICQGATIPALTVNVGAGLSVNWYATPSGGAALLSNSTSYTPTTAGTYYAEAIDAVTGCTSATRTPIVLTITPLPIANAGADQDICAGSSADLSASGGTSYQWSNGLGNAANATASPALTTTYTVTVTNNGCSATDAVTVNVAAMPTLVIGAVDCSADLTNYTINYTASNGTATASAGTLGATSISNIPIATTPVTITVTSATNATCAVSQDVNAPNCNCPSIAAPTGNDATICQGATIPALTVNVGAGLSVNWYATPSGGAALVSNSTSYTPTTAGTYYAEAIDATTGCTSATRTPIVLTITPLPIANAGADQDICAGSSANLTASGGTSYQWSNGLGNAANATASPATTTTYTVTVSDNGCSATDAVTVNVAAMPTLVIGAVDCSTDLTNYTINYTASNGTATASAGTLGATSISNIPIATTPVTITVTSATNAACLVSQDVNAPNCNCPSIAAPTGNDATICQGATIPALTVNVGAGLSVNWYATSSGGAALLSNSNSYTPTTAGTYYAEAIDAITGCTSATRTPIVLTITPLPIANAGADQDICAGSSANLTASGGTSYQWSNGLGNAANATASPALTTTYTVTVTDNGCSATDAVTVNVAAMPTLVIGAVDCSADLTNYTINYTASNGTATASAGTLGATSISNIPIATTPVTITVTSATNAACLVSQDVNAPNCNCPSIAAPTGNDATICQGATIPALTVNVGAGLSVNWYATSSGGAALVSNSNSYTPTTAGTYYAEAVDAITGCTSATRTPIVLTITPLPIANAGTDQDICAGSDASLSASGGTSYQWSNGLGNAANATASPALTTTYTVTVTDNGCSATDAVTVNVNPLADAGNDNSAVVCDNATEGTTVVNLTTLTSVGGGLFAPIGTAPALTGTNFDGAGVALGTYEYGYTVSGITPCVDDIATISITVNDCSACPNPPTANFTFDAAYCIGSGTATPTMTGTATSGVWSASPAGLSIDAATGEINLATSTAGNYTITNSVAAAGACPAVSATFNITLNNPVNAGNDNIADVCDNATDGNTTVDLSTLASVAGGTFTPVAGAPALSGTTFDGAGVTLGIYQYNYTVLGTAPCSDDVASISISVNSCFVNSCPTIVTPLDTAFALCVDKDPDLPALTDAIVFNGTSNTFAGFAWYSDAALTTPVVPADYAYSGDNCAEQQVTLYVAALCTIDPAPIAAGSLSLILYPPFDSLLLTSTAVECAVPTLTSSCDNYVITPENVPTVVNPGDSGVASWTVSYNGTLGIEPCFNEPFEVAYSCPAIICPVAAFTLSDDSLCVGDAVTLTFTGTSTPTTTYSWNIAGQTLSGIGPHNVTVNTSGILEVELIVNDGAACADTSTLDLAVSNVSLIVTATPTNVVSGASVQLSASASSALGLDINYTWTDHSSLSCLTCTTPTALPTENTIYSVAVSDELGCAASGSIAVNVFQENIAVAPSAFSPNGDNIDDIFHISGSNIASVDLYIYNRWGNEVYSAQEISTSEGWDGKLNGEYVDVAVFVYYANVHYSDGKEDFLRGNITVVR
jgi:gliding motility-associated-like protein